MKNLTYGISPDRGAIARSQAQSANSQTTDPKGSSARGILHTSIRRDRMASQPTSSAAGNVDLHA